MNPVGWFELPAVDLDRAQKFYAAVFGFDMSRRGENAGYELVWFPSVPNGPGAPGALIKGFGYKPSLEGTTIYFTAPDMDAILTRIEGAGGKIHVPKKEIGDYGWIAIFEDCEGNRVALYRGK